MSDKEVEQAVPDEVFEAEIVVPEAISAESLGLDLPADPDRAIAMLLDEVGEARRFSESYLDDLQRVVADFDNYRKRIQREQGELVERASRRVTMSLLPVLDSFDLAFSHEAQSTSEEKLLAGMRSTYQLLVDTLAKEGLEQIESEGVPFDPTRHEAAQAPAGADGGDLVVVQELRRGYTLGGLVVRPALVVVDHA